MTLSEELGKGIVELEKLRNAIKWTERDEAWVEKNVPVENKERTREKIATEKQNLNARKAEIREELERLKILLQ